MADEKALAVPAIPSELADAFKEDSKENLANVKDAFYRISIRGSRFKVEGRPIGNEGISFTGTILREMPVNIYYSTKYDGDAPTTPDCSSLGGLHPSPDTEYKQSDSCITCPKNKFGSGVDRDGNPSKGKACMNGRRLVVTVDGVDLPVLMSIPATSLKNFNAYLKSLSANQPPLPLWAVKTKFSFDASADYPKTRFEFDSLAVADKAGYDKLADYRKSQIVENCLHAYTIGSDAENVISTSPIADQESPTHQGEEDVF